MHVLMIEPDRSIVGVYSSLGHAREAALTIPEATTIETYPLDDASDRAPAVPPKQTLYKTCYYAGHFWKIIGHTHIALGDQWFYNLVRNKEDPIARINVPAEDIEGFCL
jgi:hypothetical protein